MHGDLSWWLEGKNCGWYYKALQCERSAIIGWLLYSTLDMDRDLLAESIRQKVGVHVGLRFRAISVNTQQTLMADQLVRAIHVEIDCTSPMFLTDKQKIEDLYDLERMEGFPLGIKLRLCPQYQDVTDPSSQTKFDRVRLKQAAFLANAYRQASLDVWVLDSKDPRLGNATLRQLIMDIWTHEDSKSAFLYWLIAIFKVGE